MRRRLALAILPLAVAAAVVAPHPSGATAATPETALSRGLDASLRPAGSRSGAVVVDLTGGRTLFARRADRRLVPASNQKLYTTGAALLRFGPSARMRTAVLGAGLRGGDAVYRGDLYLRGGGDPTFGSLSFTRYSYGAGATVSDLAQRLVDRTGITRIDGAIVGDETYFDRLRGTPYDGFARSPFLGGQLSGLSYNRGLTEDGGAFQSRPATFAAARLVEALERLGVHVSGGAREAPAPVGPPELAVVDSPTLAELARFTNRPSDNFFAETLLKGLGARFGAGGSTAGGAAVVGGELGRLGLRARVIDGSGLSYSNTTSPREVVRFLAAMRRSRVAAAFEQSLAVAGRNGTLSGRLNGTSAAGRCRGKTGTLPGVSALSGYCTTRAGRTLAFSILMNGVNVTRARSRQDAMAIAITRYARPAARRAARPPAAATIAPATAP